MKVLINRVGDEGSWDEFKEHVFRYNACFSLTEELLGIAFQEEWGDIWYFAPVGYSVVLFDGEIVCVQAELVTKSA